MNIKRNNNSTSLGLFFIILNSPFSTFHSAARRGISLMEVLASTFVIGVGLLGVLAVIPFGAFQVGKANNADYSANMLRDAVNEILVREMAKPKNWRGGDIQSNSNVNILTNSAGSLNCQRIIMVDPFDAGGDPTNVYKIGKNLTGTDAWQETMRGQDDIQYTIEEDKRTVLTTAGSFNTNIDDPRVVSSGKYTWFFTYRPKETGGTEPLNTVSPVSIDVLACFNRTPGDAEKERTVGVNGWTPQLNGAQLTLSDATTAALAVENTKWILVTWTENSTITGSWCKIVSRGPVNGSGPYTRIVTVIGDLSSTQPTNAFIVDGVLDHARIDNVPLY